MRGNNCNCYQFSSAHSVEAYDMLLLYSFVLLVDFTRFHWSHRWNTPQSELVHLFFVSGLLLGLIATILGFTIDLDWLKAIGIVAIVSTVVSFIVFFFCFKKKFITLTGTFGSETMRFEKTTARELEGQLSEMIHQRRIQCFLQQGNWHEPQPGPSLPIASTYFVETDRKQKKAAKIYAYDPSTYHYWNNRTYEHLNSLFDYYSHFFFISLALLYWKRACFISNKSKNK
jgi:hypothetical protein